MDILSGIGGALWGYLVSCDVIAFKADRNEWRHALSLGETADKVSAVKNKTILAGIRLSSSFSYLVSWMHEVQWISLGRFIPVVGAFALAGKTIFSIAEAKDFFNKLQTANGQEERINANLDFLAQLFFVTSYILTLTLFVIKASVISSAASWLLILGFIMVLLKGCYNYFIEKPKTLQPAPVPT